MFEVKSILFPMGFDDESLLALSGAVGLARHFEARLVLLHVVHWPVVWAGPEAALSMPLDLTGQEQVRDAEARLRALAARHVPVGVEVRTRVEWGTPARTVATVAEDEEASLVVVATHPRRRWWESLLRASPEKVVHYSSRPVRTVVVPRLSHVHA